LLMVLAVAASPIFWNPLLKWETIGASMVVWEKKRTFYFGCSCNLVDIPCGSIFSTFSFPEKINDQNTSNTVTLAKTIERSGKHSSAILLEVHCLLAACISVSVTHWTGAAPRWS
jgi:hypothetical protein